MLYRVICGCLSAAISANYPLQHPHIRRSAFYPRPGNIAITAADDIPVVTGVTAMTLFCPAAGKLMVASSQVCSVTGLTTSTRCIWNWPVRSRQGEQSTGQNSTENKFAAGSQFWNDVKLILNLVHISFLIWTSGNLQKILIAAKRHATQRRRLLIQSLQDGGMCRFVCCPSMVYIRRSLTQMC